LTFSGELRQPVQQHQQQTSFSTSNTIPTGECPNIAVLPPVESCSQRTSNCWSVGQVKLIWKILWIEIDFIAAYVSQPVGRDLFLGRGHTVLGRHNLHFSGILRYYMDHHQIVFHFAYRVAIHHIL